MPESQTSIVRQPRGKVTANGTQIPFVGFEVIKNANHGSDSFQVEMPLFDPESPHDWAWWSEQTDVEIEISVGFAQQDGSVGTWTSLIVGPVDAIAMMPLSYGHNQGVGKNTAAKVGSGGIIANEGGPQHPSGALMTIRGRDYSGTLQDSRVSKQYIGGEIKASQIIPDIVSRVPQLSVNLSQVTDPIGNTYNNQQGRLFLGKSAWDVITAVADHEGYQVKVVGRTVEVTPKAAPDTSGPFQIFYTPAAAASTTQEYQEVQSNTVTLRMSRALSIGKGVDVFVESYDHASGNRPSRKQAKVRNTKRSTGAGTSPSQLTYTFGRPGMTPAQAQQHANAKASQIAQFECEIEFQMEGDPTLTPDRAIRLSGTGTAYDQIYYPDQIDHRLQVDTGYAMEVRARNQAQGTTITDADATADEPQ